MDRNVECPKYFLSAATCCGLGSAAEDIVTRTLKNKTDTVAIRTRLVILTHTHRRRRCRAGNVISLKTPTKSDKTVYLISKRRRTFVGQPFVISAYRYRQSAASRPSRLTFVFGFRCECERKNRRRRQTPNTNRTLWRSQTVIDGDSGVFSVELGFSAFFSR